MKTLSFKYTKADNTVSNRVLIVTVSPSSMYEGIDISELEPPEMAMFEQDMDAAYNSYLAAVSTLKAAYDLNFSYRRFDPKKMTDVISETA